MKLRYIEILVVLVAVSIGLVCAFFPEIKSNITSITNVDPETQNLAEQDKELRLMMKAYHEGNMTTYWEHSRKVTQLQDDFYKLSGVKPIDEVMKCQNDPAFYNGNKEC